MLTRVERQEPSYIASGNAICTATLEDSLVISYEGKQSLIIWSPNHAPKNLFKQVKKFCLHKNSHTQMFMAVLFIIAKSWKQQKHP